MNANKAEYICSKRERGISTLSGEHMKLVDKFGCVSSTKSDVNMRQGKTWTAIDRLSIR